MSPREEAKKWVAGYTVTGMGLVTATAGIPGAGTAVCIGIEVTMCYHIGQIYGYTMTQADARSHALKIGLATVAAKIIALEALTVTGPLAYPLKAAIAGPIIKKIGDLVIEYYDDGGGGGGAVAYSDNRSRVGYYE